MSERTAVHVLVTEIFLLFKDKQNIPAYMEKNYPSMGYVTFPKGFKLSDEACFKAIYADDPPTMYQIAVREEFQLFVARTLEGALKFVAKNVKGEMYCIKPIWNKDNIGKWPDGRKVVFVEDMKSGLIETLRNFDGGMALLFLHGRTDPDENLDDWGEDGPTLFCDWVHMTYLSSVNIGWGSEEAGPMDGSGKEDAIYFHKDLIAVREKGKTMYYGDFEVMSAKEARRVNL